MFNFPNGTHNWGYWGQQLQQMKPDLQRVAGHHDPSELKPELFTGATVLSLHQWIGTTRTMPVTAPW